MSIASFCSTPSGLLPDTTVHCLLKANDIRFTKYNPVSVQGEKSSPGTLVADIPSGGNQKNPPIGSGGNSSTQDPQDPPTPSGIGIGIGSGIGSGIGTTTFAPDRFDTLYWCVYASLNGQDSYRDSIRKEFVIEKDDKFAYVDKIQASGGELRNTLKARSIQHQHVMDVLMNKRRIDIPTCVAIAMSRGMNLWIEMGHVFVRHVGDGGGDTHTAVIRRNESTGKYELVSEGWDEATISTYTHGIECDKFEIIDLAKPMKGFSVYSLPDLQDMADKVGVESVDVNGKRKLKKSLYSEISNRISLPKN